MHPILMLPLALLRPVGLLLAAGLSLSALGPVAAQEAQVEAPAAAAVAIEPVRLPPPARTRHDVALPDRTLRFTATAGAIQVAANGRPLGEAGYIAYVLDGPTPADRPVTFAINGGPGAASAWLHLGAMGPWRLPLTPGATDALALAPNAETWLDFTDLVFIDPPGTGYSRTFEVADPAPQGGQTRGRPQPGQRPTGGNPARQLWSVAGDVTALTDVIETWLKDNNRTASPRMLVGESYGGFRAPRIAALMQRRKLPLDAVVLVSPVIDFEGRRTAAGPLLFVHVLPTIAAVALEQQGTEPTRALLTAVETYARTDYLLDLLKGPRDSAARARVVDHVTKFTALPLPTVQGSNGKISGFAYAREAFRATSRYASVYDASVTAPDPGNDSQRVDPFLSGMSTPLTNAMVDLYRTRLGWHVDRPYELQSGQVLRGWLWPNSPNAPESVTALAGLLRDSRTSVMVSHGFSDLVTPYFASALQLDQLTYAGDDSRLQLKVYPGGHMFYSRDTSRRAFRQDARQLLRERTTIPAP